VGIALGMWWAYVELGWGGYWAWDPVENASLLPWLTGTAFLHSIMIQEKRGMLRKWNVTLVVSTFLLAILGTFITRSGIIQSVHSFAQSPVGTWFAGFLVASTAVTAYLVSTRLKDMASQAELESMVSREAAFLYNNLVLVGIAFSVLWGTLFPILSEWVRGEKITVGAPFFNTVNVPLGLLLLALTGIGPLIAWRRASVANIRRQFIFPGLAGLSTGVALLRSACATSTRSSATRSPASSSDDRAGVLEGHGRPRAHVPRERGGGPRPARGPQPAPLRRLRRALRHGDDVRRLRRARRSRRSSTSRSARARRSGRATRGATSGRSRARASSQYRALNRYVTAVGLSATRDGRPVGVITSEKRQHVDAQDQPTFEPSTEVGILETLKQDTYVVLAGVTGTDRAELRIAFNPLVVWAWIGAGVMAVGGLIVMWPQAERRRRESGYATTLPPVAVGGELPRAEPVPAFARGVAS
jgi:cytochrome c-type biogenesis protein CcmF